jgi:hypothetical protein
MAFTLAKTPATSFKATTRPAAVPRVAPVSRRLPVRPVRSLEGDAERAQKDVEKNVSEGGGGGSRDAQQHLGGIGTSIVGVCMLWAILHPQCDPPGPMHARMHILLAAPCPPALCCHVYGVIPCVDGPNPSWIAM